MRQSIAVAASARSSVVVNAGASRTTRVLRRSIASQPRRVIDARRKNWGRPSGTKQGRDACFPSDFSFARSVPRATAGLETHKKTAIKSKTRPIVGPDCKFWVVYDNERNPPCKGADSCGAILLNRVARVTADGKDCPESLEGLRLTETASNDHGCIKENFETGAGCDINADGTLTDCEDEYALCRPARRLPAGGCTETATQKLFVGGRLAEKRKIVWTIVRRGEDCSGPVKWTTM